VNRFASTVIAVTLSLGAAACTQTARDYGRQLLDDPSISGAQSNALACTTCHELVATPKHLRPGYTLYDAATRPSWWGGFELNLLDAINQCYVNFMRADVELAPTDDRARAMVIYLQSIAPDPSPPALPYTIVLNIADVPSGDAAAGKALYDDGCANCHGQPHTGAGRISVKASIIPDESLDQHGTDPTTGARPVTIEKTRHGKFFNVGGNMAPYSTELLSDAQLGQILGYLEQFGLPPSP
jgi:thiosulfate dehydrogenase